MAVQLVDGRVEVVRDDRLDLVAVLERRRYQEAAARASFGTTPVTEWRALAEAQRQARNREGGYWIGEADPEAARHAIRRAWPIDQVAGVLVVTDGVAAGPDTYAVPPTWADTIDTARRDPKDLVDSVHNAEEGDAEGRRWPRSKRHDDKTAVFIDLTH